MSTDKPQPIELFRAIGAVIRMERERLNLSQEDMASISGVERRTISNLERGQTDKLSHFTPIAWSLGKRLGQVVAKAEALVIDDDQLDEWAKPLAEKLEDDDS